MKKLILAWVVASLLQACAVWTKTDGSRVAGPDNAYSVELPANWVRFAAMQDRILLTRDGFGLQTIEVRRAAHDKAFPTIKKQWDANMLPFELAELVVAEFKAQGERHAASVMLNEPAKIGGSIPGVHLRLHYKNDKGLQIERDIYAYADAKGIYTLAYEAPSLHYFARDQKLFEAVVGSFRPG